MEILDAIARRCSTRRFEARQLEAEAHEAVLRAARLAPTGINLRAGRIYVLQNGATLEALNRAVFAAMQRGNAEGVDAERARQMDGAHFCFYYHAPTVWLITQPRSSYNALADTGCLLENAMLQAAALGLGSCWLNNVRRAQNDPEVQQLLRSFGLSEDELVTGGLALGYPASPLREPREPEGNEVVYVD